MNEDYQKDLRKVIRWSLVLVLALTLFLIVLSVNALKEFAYIGRGAFPNETLSVTGEGEVFATPDVAQFTFTVTEEDDSVASAQETVTGKIDAALTALGELGVEGKDIKTTGYNAYPRYTYPGGTLCTNGFCPPREQVLSGYEVSQTISVKIRDTEKAGDALSRVAGAGISNISGLQFVIDDQDSLMAEARSKAIADAQEKVRQLADDLDVSVKKVVNFSDSFGGPYPMYETAYAKEGLGGDMSVSSSPRLPTGENTIRIQVYITYEIK